jgi:hypothetical protein
VSLEDSFYVYILVNLSNKEFICSLIQLYDLWVHWFSVVIWYDVVYEKQGGGSDSDPPLFHNVDVYMSGKKHKG